MIRFIAALDNKRGVADDNGIPWQGKLPTDVGYFRNKTLHGAVMMGYGWDVEQKQPLPDRRNLVATTKPEQLRPGFERVDDARKFLQQFSDKNRLSRLSAVQGAGEGRTESYNLYDEGALEPATKHSAKSISRVASSASKQVDAAREPDIWVGGGASLFASTIDLADELYLTLIDHDFNCTKFFPQYEKDFELLAQTKPQAENGITFRFTTWKRKQ